ncbi:FHA domain-containing protein [Rubripirellula reticaptiva]|uniref:Chromosome partition protein Smc n=1 Tax=Rubripirellula reticaptiva TaxID=2528013 RepID=A0A5C6FCT3_9BACT|nr:FHA domain-containing protein [Rubripirellula reticaptiva]TWU57916.1 Chromosome partition protein Smc [Rubripirellula reticaptiva]
MSTEHASESPLNASYVGAGFESNDNAPFTMPIIGAPIPGAPLVEDALQTNHQESSAVSEDTLAGRSPQWKPPGNAENEIDCIEFRVIRSGSPVRRLRLTGSRYTFGSAEGCSIRLNDHALRPMHAVLIRDRIRVLVRAYSVPIEVNGIRKTEASLQVGDVMRLGTYQFELVSVSSSVSENLENHFADSPLRPPLRSSTSVFSSGPQPSQPPTSMEPSPHDHSTSRSALPSADDVIWRERLRREIDQWRERQVECDQREQRIDQRESTLRGRETELWSRAENLHRRESRLQTQESSVLQLHDDYLQRQQDLIDLRQKTQNHQHELDQRESEFRRQEIEYRGKLEEASRQLAQSRQQAESATQAVARMREQFDSLNQQIDELSSQQHQLSAHEGRQQSEHEELREELARQRDEAIDAHAHSESLRLSAEARIEEMEAQLERLRSESNDDHEAELAASEKLIGELRAKVELLQASVVEASEESARLRNDYEEACQSVRQLESLVAQSNQRGDTDRESWIAEADELRAAIDQLSLELARANGEVAQLSEANESITSRLDLVQRERDEAETRPTHEAFDSLRDELDAANMKLAEMKSDYEQTLARLDDAEQKRQEEASRIASEAALRTSEDSDDSPIAGAAAFGSAAIGAALLGHGFTDETESDADDSESQLAIDNAIDLGAINAADALDCQPEYEPEAQAPFAAGELVTEEPVSEADEDEVWPTYQWADASTPNDQESDDAAQLQGESIDNHSSDHQEPKPASQWQPDSEWDETPEADNSVVQDNADSAHDNLSASVWNYEPGEAEAPLYDQDHSESEAESHLASDDHDDANPEAIADTNNGNDAAAESPFGGSLASLLIKDIEAESDIVNSNDAEFNEAESGYDDSNQCESQLADDEHYDRDPAADVDGTFLMSNSVVDADDSVSESSSLWGHDADESDSSMTDDSVQGWDREYVEESDVDDAPISALQDELPDDEYDRTEMVYDRFNDESTSEPDAAHFDDPASEDANEIGDTDSSFSEDADQPTSDVTAEHTSIETTVSEDGDDDSIEAYMNRLLNRVQGSPESLEATKPETVSLSMSTSTLTKKSESLNGDEVEATETQSPIDPNAPLVPRSQAPERGSDLSAMRKLANESARGAISHSANIQTRNIQIAGLCNLAVAGVAVIAVLLASVMLDGMLLYVAWAMAIIVAAISVRDAMGNFSEARRRQSSAQDDADAKAEAADDETDE